VLKGLYDPALNLLEPSKSPNRGLRGFGASKGPPKAIFAVRIFATKTVRFSPKKRPMFSQKVEPKG
jgi:hypothetical protein